MFTFGLVGECQHFISDTLKDVITNRSTRLLKNENVIMAVNGRFKKDVNRKLQTTEKKYAQK